MKLPDVIRTYCPFCKAHNEHEISLMRKGKEKMLSRGRRKYEDKKKGYGSSPRTPKKQVYKIGKRVVTVMKCKKCGKKHQKVFGARTKKKAEIGK